MKHDRQESILNLLRNFHGLDSLKELFWSELNYERVNQPLSRRGWTDTQSSALADDPLLFAAGGADNDFHVVYARLNSDRLQLGMERPVVSRMLAEHPYALFVLSNAEQDRWHFLNVKYDESLSKRRLFRRITVDREGRLRTASERIALLDLASIGPQLSHLSPLDIQNRHDEAFDVEKVTKDFYRELADWYFWAVRHVRFPRDAPKEADGHDHISVIRMITRLIFCWFVMERGLIPQALFEERRLHELLHGFAPDEDARKETVFYKAILQNLFFATLNTEMDKRGWARDDQNFMAHSLYRYRDLFKKPGEALALFKNIPFLNGGLFECLDKDLGAGVKSRYVRIDGFSRRPDSQPVVPDFLFFGTEREEDLSADYGDKKYRKARVRGLIHILRQYKFTIEENTPLDQEVALDPELSGKVFENLLAAYNPETGATARKQTGSFYTPREIVDYMVDEALIAYLKGCLTAEDDEEKLRRLLSWEESGHDFDATETDALIAAIDGLKALDPAVGSGAFPMGILHKLVFILGKLDPRNEQWEQRQIQRVRDAIDMAEKIEDATIRERTVRELEQQIAGIEDAFQRNELDYGRKLYLIENCIYGVDIQSIAVQIAKMRFFISLIVDQRIDPEALNLGVRPLPNLETKFVAANTLIGIEKPQQMSLRNPEIDAKETELRRVRERHFMARTLISKAKCREQDKKMRGEIAELLKRDGWGDTTAKRLAAWDPYDQNASADFFDPEWMFGVRDGFNVVIGNPPYVFGGGKGISEEEKHVYKRIYYSGSKKINLFAIFIERGSKLLQSRGTLTYILPNTLLRVTSYCNTRQFIIENLKVREIVDLDIGVFDGVTASTIVISLEKACPETQTSVKVKRGYEDTLPSMILQKEWRGKGYVFDIFSSDRDRNLLHKLCKDSIPLGELCSRLRFGIVISGNFNAVVGNKKLSSKWKPFLEGDEIGPFFARYKGRYLLYDKKLLHRSRTPDIFETRKIMIQRITGGDTPLQATLDEGYFYNKESILNLILDSDEVSYEYMLGLLNSRLANWYYKRRFTNASKLTVNLSKEYVGQIPVKTVDKRRQASVENLVTRILATKATNQESDTSALEREIDKIMYELYGLTKEEIAIVEGRE